MKDTRKISLLIITLITGVWYWFSLPDPLFDKPYSTVLLDRDGELLGARIATDEQWRFPLNDSVPEKVKMALLYKEDRHFYHHPGFNPVSLIRAFYLNIKHGEVVSGGSTITMQLVRLSKNNPPRTVWEKCKEIIMATRVELSYSKDEILAMYATHAPFGGNVVGYETASWRYFNRNPHQLTWAEAATLAVLPNAPGLIHPGRNRDQLNSRREELLKVLHKHEVIDERTLELALLEQVPASPQPLPDEARHLTDLVMSKERGKPVYTTLDHNLQNLAIQVLNRNLQRLSANQINNGAILLIDNRTGSVRAYVGNGSYKPDVYGVYNDMIQTPRSPGSILKPFLYASMFHSGELFPEELVKDVPTFIGGFNPENFNRDFDGAVPAGDALARSLNIPAVLLLREYTPERFLRRLHGLGFENMGKSAGHYGLSLILGGAEVTPWELGRAYYRMASTLNSYDLSGFDSVKSIPDLHYSKTEEVPVVDIDKGSIYTTFKILTRVDRPDSEMGWKKFGNGSIAWKTGTSFGFRDAWAVGITPAYTCVVWAGNADGEGRPGLIGVETAGPILFDMFNQLPNSGWFREPLNEMVELKICNASGMKATDYCPESNLMMLPAAAEQAGTCIYHKKIFVNNAGQRVTRGCERGDEIHSEYCFVLPPTQAWYYSRKNPSYNEMPKWKPGCGNTDLPMVDVIYPQKNGEIFIPREIGGEEGRVVLEVAHQQPDEKLYWHLNGRYLGETTDFHKWAINLGPGAYVLHVEDERGNSARRSFKVALKG